MNYDLPHRRQNLLTGEWVLVSPQRARRPWLGQVERPPQVDLPEYDPTCYLCPGNLRAGGVVNPRYSGTYVFDNDFPALLPPQPGENQEPASASLFVAEPEVGVCRVVCFSPRHDLTLPELPTDAALSVVQTWTEQTRQLGKREEIGYVQVFENKGAVMGCSNPHPHSQIWASGCIPNEPRKELACQADYLAREGRCLLCDYLAAEEKAGERLVAENAGFVALVPFWAVWPFEVLVIARRHLGSLVDLNAEETAALAEILQAVTTRYDNLFEVSFPYSMGFHQTPSKDGPYPHQHLHAHFYPPLLRSATVRKFMVGYEMLAVPQRDITPETAAGRLRETSPLHYKATVRG